MINPRYYVEGIKDLMNFPDFEPFWQAMRQMYGLPFETDAEKTMFVLGIFIALFSVISLLAFCLALFRYIVQVLINDLKQPYINDAESEKRKRKNDEPEYSAHWINTDLLQNNDGEIVYIPPADEVKHERR